MNAAAASRFAAEVVGARAGYAEPVTGGLLNLVWRVPTDAGPVIVKHAPPYVASAPEIALDPARMDYEALALSLLARDLVDVVTPAVQPPALHRYDPGLRAMVMEDLGPLPTLDDWLIHGGEPDRLAALGAFVAALHGRSPAVEGLAEMARNDGVQRTRYAVQYEPAGRSLAAGGVADAEALGETARALGRRFMAPGRCLVMGDLWPRSVLVSGEDLTVIDWEFCHWGRPAQDLGHLAAHLWMLRHRAGAGEGAWRAFLDAYRAGAALSEEDLRQTARHFGCEILARTTGAFQAGYLYDGLAHDAPALREAVDVAAAALRDPASAPLGLWGG